MQLKDRIQKRQEEQYQFPYHYIPCIEGNKFSQAIVLSWGYEYLSYIYFVIDIISKLNFNTLLDIGCGDGKFLYEINKRIPNKKLYGVDLSTRAISFAKLLNSSEINFICADITDKNVLCEQFDIITLIETLEHIEPSKIDKFLYNIKIRLAPNGRFVLTVPSKNLKLIDKHYQHFDLDELKEIILPHFKIENVFFINKKSKLEKKIIRKLFVNNIFILNQKRIMWFLYKLYCKYFLLAKENNAKRIVLVCSHN
ncbi:MAG: class I SAM-dependent methyltransferase [Desulfonauticus sp.]|nr:class I SAM-dependent methyltransferase [Desulfonauticus sp.]